MSNRCAIKMILGGAAALVAFALDGRLSPGPASDQKIEASAEEPAWLACAPEFSSKPGVNDVSGQ
jgi:hypothetical protein